MAPTTDIAHLMDKLLLGSLTMKRRSFLRCIRAVIVGCCAVALIIMLSAWFSSRPSALGSLYQDPRTGWYWSLWQTIFFDRLSTLSYSSEDRSASWYTPDRHVAIPSWSFGASATGAPLWEGQTVTLFKEVRLGVPFRMASVRIDSNPSNTKMSRCVGGAKIKLWNSDTEVVFPLTVRWHMLLMDVVVFASVWWIAESSVSVVVARRRRRASRCIHCGYPVDHGITRGLCPECGETGGIT